MNFKQVPILIALQVTFIAILGNLIEVFKNQYEFSQIPMLFLFFIGLIIFVCAPLGILNYFLKWETKNEFILSTIAIILYYSVLIPIAVLNGMSELYVAISIIFPWWLLNILLVSSITYFFGEKKHFYVYLFTATIISILLMYSINKIWDAPKIMNTDKFSIIILTIISILFFTIITYLNKEELSKLIRRKYDRKN